MQAKGSRAYGGAAEESGGPRCPQIIPAHAQVPPASVFTHHSAEATIDNAAEKQCDGDVGQSDEKEIIPHEFPPFALVA